MATLAQGHEAGRLANQIDALVAFRTNLQSIVSTNLSINQILIGQGSAIYNIILPFNQNETTHILNDLITSCTVMINQSITALAAL